MKPKVEIFHERIAPLGAKCEKCRGEIWWDKAWVRREQGVTVGLFCSEAHAKQGAGK